jgi:NAD(P)-dependent dehydrogenase (short-subunit alcohol dehydrogenase family)
MGEASKHAVLTGGASGIGAEILRKLQAQGARVTVLDRADCPAADRALRVDMSDLGAIDAAVALIDEPVDMLFNIAGIPPRAENGALVLAVNLFGLRHLTEALMPKLVDAAPIVNMASMAGAAWPHNIDEVKTVLAMPNDSDPAAALATLGIDATRAYNLSKEAVIVWTIQQTALGLPRGIRMNSVCPAAVSTGILDDFKSAFGPQVTAAIARAGRASAPDEVADLALFLASDASRWIKGGEYKIDGGIGASRVAATMGLIET